MPFLRPIADRRAMTLVELMVVVIIIGILVSLAVPMFSKTMENTIGREATVSLDQIWAGERIYNSTQGFYFPKSVATEGSIATLNAKLRTDLDASADRNWNYSVTSSADDAFKATATRRTGGNKNETLWIEEDGDTGGTFSP